MTTAYEAPIWQLPFLAPNGHTYRWWHMPGSDSETRKMNFALFRRGLVKLTEIAEEDREEDHSNDEPIAQPEGGASKTRPRIANPMQRNRKMPKASQTHQRAGNEAKEAVPAEPVKLTTSERFPNGLPSHMRPHCEPGELESLYRRVSELAKLRGLRDHDLRARFGLDPRSAAPSHLRKGGKTMKERLEHIIAKLSSPDCEKVA